MGLKHKMNEQKINEIMSKAVKYWEIKYGRENIDLQVCNGLKNVLELSPHEDGIMPVENMDTGKTHLVPMIDIIVKGIKGSELDKYPVKRIGETIKAVEPFFELRKQNKCPFCKKDTENAEFDNSLSRREFEISGLCQNCQNETFKEEK